MRRTAKVVAALSAAFALAVLLTACGGGGGSAAETPSTPNPPPSPISQDYVVFAWNDLGMHCLNPTYDHAVILPPYNTVWAQVVKRGNTPKVVTSGVTVDYRILNNTYSYGKVTTSWNFSQFWDNMKALFNPTPFPPHDKGLNLVDAGIQNGLSGSMVAKTDHFQVNGIPLTPINDSDLATENPYQVAEITVKNASGIVVAQTRATVPTSFEINCGLCHTKLDGNPLLDVIKQHNARPGTTVLLSETAPVLCASCHGSPALGATNAGSSGIYLSKAMHGFHASKTTPSGAAVTCYDCHPGGTAKCNRSIRHTATDGNCTSCHGDMANVANTIAGTPARIPWEGEPKCGSCHTSPSAATFTTVQAGVTSTIPEVDTGTTLYRNAQGHGGLACATCHGSPHAMVPSSQASDNYQANQYHGKLPSASHPEKSIGSCGVCHGSSKPGSISEWSSDAKHDTARTSACNVCHTGFTNPIAGNWPHQFQWKSR